MRCAPVLQPLALVAALVALLLPAAALGQSSGSSSGSGSGLSAKHGYGTKRTPVPARKNNDNSPFAGSKTKPTWHKRYETRRQSGWAKPGGVLFAQPRQKYGVYSTGGRQDLAEARRGHGEAPHERLFRLQRRQNRKMKFRWLWKRRRLSGWLALRTGWLTKWKNRALLPWRRGRRLVGYPIRFRGFPSRFTRRVVTPPAGRLPAR